MWEQALGLAGDYDPTHVVTAEESSKILSLTTLVITGIGADDVDSCGLDKLVGLENLGIALSDQAGEANLTLPGNLPNLAYLEVAPSGPTTSLAFDPNGFSGHMTLSGNFWKSNLASFEIGAGSLSRLDIYEVPTLETLDLSESTTISRLGITNCESLVNMNLSGKGIERLKLQSVSPEFRLDLNGCEELTRLSLFSCNLTGVDFSQAPNLTLLNLEFVTGLTDLDLTAQHDLTEISVRWSGYTENGVDQTIALKKVEFADDAPLKEVTLSNGALTELTLPTASLSVIERLDVSSNKITSIDVPNTDTLDTLDVAGNELSELTIPEKARTSLSNLYVFDNHLRDLDLSGMNLDWYVEASGLDGIGQTIELTGQEQAGGSVVVSLSDQLGHISSLSSNTGSYDKGAGTLTYRSAADAKADKIAFEVDTHGTVERDGANEPALLPGTATIETEPYEATPVGPDGQGDGTENAGENEAPDAGASEPTDDSATLAKTSDAETPAALAVLISAILAASTALAGALRIRIRKTH